MSTVRVSIGPPRRGGALRPSYDSEADVLAVTCEGSADWVYGVDMSGIVVFDLDSNRSLANFDVHVGRHLWERGPVQPWPEDAAAGTIIFAPSTIVEKSLHISALRLR